MMFKCDNEKCNNLVKHGRKGKNLYACSDHCYRELKKTLIFFIVSVLCVSIASALPVVQHGYLHYEYDCNSSGYFASMIKSLNASGYSSVTISQYDLARKGLLNLSDKSIMLDFDDGYRWVYTCAYPIMKSYGMSGVIAYPTGATPWYSPKMSWDDLKDLQSNGWDVGSHTRSDADFLKSPYRVNGIFNLSAIDNELLLSKEDIFNNTGVMPKYFVFPKNRGTIETLAECYKYYDYCASGENMSDWNYITLNQRLDLGLGRNYLEGGHKNKTIDMIMFNKRLIEAKQWNYMSNKLIDMTPINETVPVIPQEVNTTINGYNYKCTRI